LKQNGKKVAMKIISHAWRTYKSRFVKCWRKKMNPFNTYKELREEDWERFVAKCESKDFVVKSEYMQWLRLQKSLITPTTAPVMLENRGSGNRRMTNWPKNVLIIHMRNSVDG
jgi:hypothetical protein